MPTTHKLRQLSFEETLAQLDAYGAALVDLRPVNEYLDVHVPGSLSLQYEAGPGLAARARECIPLDVPLVLADLGHGDLDNAAASLRGKGFAVLGSCRDAINEWARLRDRPASTETATGDRPPPNATLLDVADAAVRVPRGAPRIPVDTLWDRIEDVPEGRLAIAAGYGVRAALAVGILERHGHADLVFWRTR